MRERLKDLLAPPGSADVWATFPTGSSCDEDGRGRPHQRVAEQNPRERQNVRGAAIGGSLALTLTPLTFADPFVFPLRGWGGRSDAPARYFTARFVQTLKSAAFRSPF